MADGVIFSFKATLPKTHGVIWILLNSYNEKLDKGFIKLLKDNKGADVPYKSFFSADDIYFKAKDYKAIEAHLIAMRDKYKKGALGLIFSALAREFRESFSELGL